MTTKRDAQGRFVKSTPITLKQIVIGGVITGLLLVVFVVIVVMIFAPLVKGLKKLDPVSNSLLALATNQAKQEEMLLDLATQVSVQQPPIVSEVVQAPSTSMVAATGTPTANQEEELAVSRETDVSEVLQPSLSVSSTPPTAIVAPSPLIKDVFQTPVECQQSFNQESSWLICEPGVILDNTAAWVIPSTEAKYFANVPEGGFTYFSMGQGTIMIDGITLSLSGEKGLNYLVIIRGRIDDGIIDSDLNLTAEITGFVPGHAIWSIMPPGAYVSKDWFRQQLVTSTTAGGTNCGATGCSRVRIILFDVDSHLYQMFEISRDIDTWELIEKN